MRWSIKKTSKPSSRKPRSTTLCNPEGLAAGAFNPFDKTSRHLKAGAINTALKMMPPPAAPQLLGGQVLSFPLLGSVVGPVSVRPGSPRPRSASPVLRPGACMAPPASASALLDTALDDAASLLALGKPHAPPSVLPPAPVAPAASSAPSSVPPSPPEGDSRHSIWPTGAAPPASLDREELKDVIDEVIRARIEDVLATPGVANPALSAADLKALLSRECAASKQMILDAMPLLLVQNSDAEL